MLPGEEWYPMRKVDEVLSGRVRSLTFAVVCSALIFTGCVSSKGQTTPAPTASVVSTVVAMGKAAKTAVGNTVVVRSYVSPVVSSKAAGPGLIYAAADVEACAGPDASSQTGVARNLFAVQTQDQTGWPSVDPVKQPALRATYLAPNKCERGWVTFQVPKAQKPLFVVLLASAVVKWKIP
jgi:hypothetical protein